jgi:hypothetical protein
LFSSTIVKTVIAAFLSLGALAAAGCSSGNSAAAGSATPVAQTVGRARITVTESGSGAPVSGATVRVGDFAALTGADGSCSFSGVRSGSSVSVARPGYQSCAAPLAFTNTSSASSSLSLSRLDAAARYDLVVVGAGTGGVAAAIQAARMGLRVALMEETDWIGGQMTAAAVTSLDEGNFLKAGNRSGIYREFVELVKGHYAALGKSTGTAYFTPASTSFEPSVGQKVLYRMLPASGQPSGPTLDLYLRAKVTATLAAGSAVSGVVLADGSRIESKVTIDATEYGDLLPLAGARYRAGNSTSDALDPQAKLNPITWTAVIRKYQGVMDRQLLIPNAPPGYQDALAKLRVWLTLDGARGDLWYRGGPLDYTKPFGFAFHNAWRGMPDSANPANYDASGSHYLEITKSGINSVYNDHPVSARYLEDPAYRKEQNCAAKLMTLRGIYYMQSELGQENWSVAADEGFDTPYSREESACPDLPPELAAVERHFPVIPYVREGRRAIGIMTLTAQDTKRDGKVALKNFPSSLAVADYPYDIHGGARAEELDCGDKTSDIVRVWSQAGGTFQAPFEIFLPETVDGLVLAEKNLSASRLVTSAIRMQPSTMMTGQAAGALAAVAVQRGVQPRQVKPIEVQWRLLEAGCVLALHNPADVPFSHPYWKEIQLAILYDLAQYTGGNFEPDGSMTQSGLASLLSRTFEVALEPPGDGATSATRADFALLLASALRLDLSQAPTTPAYDDLPPSHPAFRQVQLLHQLGILDAPGAGTRSFQPDREVSRGEIMSVALNSARASGHSRLNKPGLDPGAPGSDPIAGSITINGGAEVAAGPAVTVSLSALATGAPVDAMQLKVDAGNWGGWEPLSATRALTLAGGNGLHAVYVRYRDAAGNISQVYSDSITVNAAAPTGSIAINDGAESTASPTVTLRLSASSSTSQVTSMQFSKDGTNWYGWEPFAGTRSAQLVNGAGVNTLYVRYRDLAGNVSQAYSDSITLNVVTLTGSISINDGAESTVSSAVTLRLSASSSAGPVTSMRFSKDGTYWYGWEPFIGTRSAQLVNGAGENLVYVRFRDSLGNVSQAYWDSIALAP